MSATTRRRLLLWLWVNSLLVAVTAFLPPIRTTHRLPFLQWAKKIPKASSSSVTNNKSSTGFGTSAPSSSQETKSRTVSGFTGSGTKVLRQAANTFDAIRQDLGVNACVDVYVQSPLHDKSVYWFVGKVAHRSNTSPVHAIVAQKRLILEYASRQLRPQALGGPFSSSLQLWMARGDSEMDAVQNKVHLTKVEGSLSCLPQDFSIKDVGYNPEVYVGNEVYEGGLRIVRDEEGKPVKPAFDINESL